jgi:hypothetical protein
MRIGIAVPDHGRDRLGEEALVHVLRIGEEPTHGVQSAKRDAHEHDEKQQQEGSIHPATPSSFRLHGVDARPELAAFPPLVFTAIRLYGAIQSARCTCRALVAADSRHLAFAKILL